MHEMLPKRFNGRAIVVPAFFGVIVLAAAAWLASAKFLSTPYTILVDGKPVATVESMKAAKKVLDSARVERANGTPVGSVRFIQNVTLRRAAKSSDVADTPEAVRSVEEATTIEGDLYAINLGGEALVAFVDERDAHDTMRMLKEHYERKLGGNKADSSFKGNVFVEKRHVGLDKLKNSPQDAVEYLTNTSKPAVEYIMKPGDRVVRLARQFNVPMDDLKKLNPGKDLDFLVEGDRLIIKPAETPITVVSKAMINKTVDVAPPSPGRRYRSSAQKSGKRQMQVLVTYENGQQVNEEVISQITTWNRPKNESAVDEEDSWGTRRHYRRHSSHRRSISSDDE